MLMSPQSPLRPYIQTDLGSLYLGDSLLLMDLLGDDSIDMIVTDPPYSSGGNFRTDRIQPPSSKYVKRLGRLDFSGDSRDQLSFYWWCYLWLSKCLRLLKPGGILCQFSDWRQLPIVSNALQVSGFIWRGVAVWDKTEAVRPQKGRFRNQCEYIVWGTKGAKPQEGKILPGVCRQVVIGAQKKHITEKPIEVMRWLVSMSNEDDTILDPFIGSGQTARACEDLKRRWIGMEINAEIADIAKSRIVDHTQQMTL